MKLTVGPLPAGVYWRRRAIVGGVVLIAALMLWASCGGGADPDDKKKTSANAASGAATTTTAAAEPTVTIQVPTTGEPAATKGDAVATTTTGPASAAAPPPPTGTTPPCADADITLVAASQQAVQFRGAYLEFTLKVKNTSTHDCVRDLGADFQELYLTVGAVKMWTSDKCETPHGSKPTVLKPGIEQAFSTTWNGKANNNGCENREVPPAGKYQLVGRLDTKVSEPVQVQLT